MHDDATTDSQLNAQQTARPHWLRRRASGIVLTLIGLLVLAAPMLFRKWRLSCVPDIGDPFPITAVLKPISERENASPLFKEAFALLEDLPAADMDEYLDEWFDGWDPTDNQLNKYMKLNRRALEKWRDATEKEDYQFVLQSKVGTETDVAGLNAFRELHRLCGFEIERLTELHRPAEAFPWLRASFRSSGLMTRNALMINRMWGSALFAISASSAKMWMQHPDVTADDLRKLLLVVQETAQLMEKPSTTVKMDHLISRQAYAEWSYDEMTKSYEERRKRYPGSIDDRPFQSRWEAWLLAEPEFSRRLTVHITANVLAFVDDPRRKRPPQLNGHIFDESAIGVAPAGYLPAQELIDCLKKSKFFNLQRSGALSGLLDRIDREQARNACLQVALAAQSYHREHGEFPRRLTDLQLDHLSSLPDDPYASQPMPVIYRRTGSEAVVYSRFTNGVDDNGATVTYDEAGGKLPLDHGIRIHTPSDPSVTAPQPK